MEKSCVHNFDTNTCENWWLIRLGIDSTSEEEGLRQQFLVFFKTRLFLELLQLLNNVIPRQVENEGNGFIVMEGVDRIYFSMYVLAYPAAAPLCGRRRWYSTSSTVHTAPLTFSTRIKHLWSDKLWRTAF